MSKEYKLIKEYPGSPKLGFTVKFKTGFPFVSPAKIEAGIECNLSLVECQNNPEFWEEIKEFQILEIRRKPNSNGHACCQIWKWGENNDYTLDEMLNHGDCVSSDHYFIYSVKRLSDNKIFVIGDLCNPINLNVNRTRIKRFEFIPTGAFRVVADNFYMNLGGIEHSIDEESFQKIQKIKEGANLKLKEAQKLLDEVKAKINKL